MKLIDNNLYIEFSEMLAVGVPIDTLKQAKSKQRTSWSFIDDPEDKRKVLIEYEKLGTTYKDKLKARFGNPYDFVARQPIKNMVSYDSKAEAFFLAHRYGEDKMLPIEHVKKYSLAASWLNMFKEAKTDKKQIKKLLNLSVIDFFNQAMEVIKIEKIDLPSSYRRLHARIDQYEKEGYPSLISTNFGNKKAAKVNDEISEALLLEMLANPLQFDDVFIWQQYNIWAEKEGRALLKSPETVRVHRRKNNHLIIVDREGNAALRDKYLKQVKGFRPTFPLAKIESDDNHIDLQFLDIDTGNKYAKYKAIVVVDTFNDYVIGYSYTSGEITTDLIKAAYINAMYYIRSITGAWHLPHQTSTDRWGIKSLEAFYESMGNYFKTPVGSKGGRYIEPFFSSPLWKRNQKIAAIGVNNYTGHNMTAKFRGVNTEVVAANIKNRPVLGHESEHQIEQFFHRLRHMPDTKGISRHEQWMAAWNTLTEDKKRMITDEQFLLIFGIQHNHQGNGIRITNRGVEPVIHNTKYSYDIIEYNLSHIGKSVSVYFDPFDMSRVLVTDHESIRLLAREAKLHSRALEDSHTDSRTYLNSVLQEKTDSVKEISKKSARRKEVIEDHFEDAEAVLQSGVTVKEITYKATQKYIEQNNNNGFYADEM